MIFDINIHTPFWVFGTPEECKHELYNYLKQADDNILGYHTDIIFLVKYHFWYPKIPHWGGIGK